LPFSLQAASPGTFGYTLVDDDRMYLNLAEDENLPVFLIVMLLSNA
jgi:hypothetical protein